MEIQTVTGLLHSLQARLPELEWQLSKMQDSWLKIRVPPGIFRTSYFLEEIKADIITLSHASSLKTRSYVAQKLNQKVHVLVRICKQHQKTESKHSKPLLSTLSSRQQYVQNLFEEIERLHQQYQALCNKKQKVNNHTVLIALEEEIGLIQKKVTLAEEEYKKIVGASYSS